MRHTKFSGVLRYKESINLTISDCQQKKKKKEKKKTSRIVGFALPAYHSVKLKEHEKRYKYLDLAKELNKLWNMKETVIPIVISALDTVTKGLIKRLEEPGNKRTRGDHPNYSIIENGQNTEKSPGDLWRLAVTQTPVKDYQLRLA